MAIHFFYIQQLGSYHGINDKLFDKADIDTLRSRIDEACRCFMNIKNPIALFKDVPDELTKIGIEHLFYSYGRSQDIIPSDGRTKDSLNKDAIKKAREFIQENYKGQFEYLFIE